MPNYVRTEIDFIGDPKDVMEVINFVTNENMDFDFRKIIPYPKYWECPEKYLVSPTDITKDEYGLHSKKHSLCLDKEIPYLDWYSWQMDNWGTKWNACETAFFNDGSGVAFETAWSFCCPILKKLSELFPTVEFAFRYADEDIGCNCDSGTAKNGVVQFDNLDSYHATELAITLWCCEDDYKVIDGEWKYIRE